MEYTRLCDCDSEISERNDPLLPDYVVIVECMECEAWAELDKEDGTLSPA